MRDRRDDDLRRTFPRSLGRRLRAAAARVRGAAGGRVAALLALLALVAAPLAADTVTLVDGRVIEGEVVSAAGADVVEIRITQGGLTAVQRFDRRQVARIEIGPTARQRALSAIAERRAALTASEGAGTPAAWLALAKQAKELGEAPLARELAGEVLVRDRHDADAHRLLGHAVQNGVWMLPREAAVARGQVYFRGRWVAWTERQQVLVDEAIARKEAEEARQQLLEQRRADAAAASVAAASSVQVPSSSYTYGTYGAGYGYGYGAYSSWPSNGRVVYWPSAGYCGPGYYGGHHHGGYGGGLVVAGSGTIGNTSWALRWRW